MPHESDKLEPLWTGPCEVLERIGLTGRYRVAVRGDVIDIYADRLKLYLANVDGTKIILNYYRPHHEVPEDDSFVVEKIIGHRMRADQRQWRVRWQGYDPSFDSWEQAASFICLLQQDWMRYNRQHHIDVPLGDLVAP